MLTNIQKIALCAVENKFIVCDASACDSVAMLHDMNEHIHARHTHQV